MSCGKQKGLGHQPSPSYYQTSAKQVLHRISPALIHKSQTGIKKKSRPISRMCQDYVGKAEMSAGLPVN